MSHGRHELNDKIPRMVACDHGAQNGIFAGNRQYLDEALAVRTVGLDPVGHMVTLRALSAVYVDEGRIDAAVAADAEALSLATSPSRRARMLIRLATDTAAAGRVGQALESLRTALDGPNAYDPAIRAEALIARGHIYRVSGKRCRC